MPAVRVNARPGPALRSTPTAAPAPTFASSRCERPAPGVGGVGEDRGVQVAEEDRQRPVPALRMRRGETGTRRWRARTGGRGTRPARTRAAPSGSSAPRRTAIRPGSRPPRTSARTTARRTSSRLPRAGPACRVSENTRRYARRSAVALPTPTSLPSASASLRYATRTRTPSAGEIEYGNWRAVVIDQAVSIPPRSSGSGAAVSSSVSRRAPPGDGQRLRSAAACARAAPSPAGSARATG